MNDKSQKVSQNREKKEVIVAEVTDKANKAKAMVFTNYSGLTHKQLEQFKREIKKADAEFLVAKNTLLKRALGEKIAGQENEFVQPTGTMFVFGDVVTPLKTLAKLIKDLEKPQIKFGLLSARGGSASGRDEFAILTKADVIKLSSLPSREVLLAQLAGMLNSPIQGLHRALSWNLQKFVMTLNAVTEKKRV